MLRELAQVAFSDIRDYVEWGPGGVRLSESSELGDDVARVVAEVSETTNRHGGSIKFKLHDKMKALELLGRHVRLFQDDGPQRDQRVPITQVTIVLPAGHEPPLAIEGEGHVE